MNKKLEKRIIEIFNSGIENVRELRHKAVPILKKNRSEAEAYKLWNFAWSDDDNVRPFLNKLTDEELSLLSKAIL